MSNGDGTKDSCSIGQNGCHTVQEMQKELLELDTITTREGGILERLAILFKWKDDTTKTMMKHSFILGGVVVLIEIAFKFIK